MVEAKSGIESLDALFRAEARDIANLPDQFCCAPTNTTVCGNHPAKYVSYTNTSSTGLPVTSEVVITVFGTTGYSARYSKSISRFANAAAERSLTTLCGCEASHEQTVNSRAAQTLSGSPLPHATCGKENGGVSLTSAH
jgi:hypothetical protein